MRMDRLENLKTRFLMVLVFKGKPLFKIFFPLQNLLDKIKPTNPASTLNSYVRLVMNLVNAYIR